jgi:glutamate dehydrogenase
VERIDDEAARERVTTGLRRVYADVAMAVADWAAMRERVDAVARTYRLRPPLPADEVAEAAEFLDWIGADNFTFLGVREYRFPDGDTAADPVEGTGLGVLRDPAVRLLRRGRELVAITPEIRAFLDRPQALIITKANVKSRVHRRVHLDYVGVKLFTRDGRLEGELRIVGLFTSDAYTSTTNEVPYLRRKVGNVVTRARFDPASHAGRALLNVLENYPRDELFQIDENTLYHFALDIMALSERPRIRALPAPTSSTASSPCSCSSRRTATTAPSAAVSASSWPAFSRAACRGLPAYPEGPLARTQFIIGRDEGRRPRSPARRSSGDRRDRAHLGRRAARRARGIDRRRARPRARRPLRERLRRRLPGGLRAEAALADIAILEQLSDARPARSTSTGARAIPRRASTSRSIPAARRCRSPSACRCSRTRLPGRERAHLPGRRRRRLRTRPDLAARHGAGARRGRRDRHAEHPGPDRGGAARAVPGPAESDGFNRLVLEAGLGWRDVAMVRALGRYLRQIRVPTRRITWPARSPATAPSRPTIVRLFYARFDPRTGETGRAERGRDPRPHRGGPARRHEPRRRPHPAPLRELSWKPASAPTSSRSTPTACRARPSRSSSNARASRACRCPSPSMRSSSIHLASRACICASARLPARPALVRPAAGFPAPRCWAS